MECIGHLVERHGGRGDPLFRVKKEEITEARKADRPSKTKPPTPPHILRSGFATVVSHCTRAPLLFVAASEVKMSRQTPLGRYGLAIIKITVL